MKVEKKRRWRRRGGGEKEEVEKGKYFWKYVMRGGGREIYENYIVSSGFIEF